MNRRTSLPRTTHTSPAGTVLAALALVAGLVASVVGCSSGHADTCTPGASVACTGPGGCTGGQVCSNDGTSYGSCDCDDNGNGDDSGPDGAIAAGEDAAPYGCPPCWKDWACLEDGNAADLVYFTGTQNADGTCTLTPWDPGISKVTLECAGQTNQTPWTVPAEGQIEFVEPSATLSCSQT